MTWETRTNWYVLTGRPCSGISTTLEALRAAGFDVVAETARTIIDEKLRSGLSIDQIRCREQAFQEEVFERKIAIENGLPANQIRILDRGLPDSAAYHELAGLDPLKVLELCKRNFYSKVFFLEPLPYARDYARTEDASSLQRLGDKLRTVYLDLGYRVVSVPAGSLESRVSLIRQHISSTTA